MVLGNPTPLDPTETVAPSTVIVVADAPGPTLYVVPAMTATVWPTVTVKPSPTVTVVAVGRGVMVVICCCDPGLMTMVVLGATISEGPSSKPTPFTSTDVRAEVGSAKLWSPMTTVEGSITIGTPLTMVLGAGSLVGLGIPDNIRETIMSPNPTFGREVVGPVLDAEVCLLVVVPPEGGAC